jgi:hypothetical protein
MILPRSVTSRPGLFVNTGMLKIPFRIKKRPYLCAAYDSVLQKY